MEQIWIRFLLKGFLILTVMYAGGFMVRRWGVRVNYTRKLNHFVLLAAPQLMDWLLKNPTTGREAALAAAMTPFMLAMYVQPVRRRVPIIDTMFASFDRPEDRPHTLLWLVTQCIAAAVVFIIAMFILRFAGAPQLVFLLLLVVYVGDGLAEPIGVRFGRWHYSVRALFTDRRYTRSDAGSACVFVVSVVSLLLFYDAFSALQLAILLVAFPAAMTLTEAVSPHTWDSPFLLLVGAIVLVVVKLLVV